MPKVSIILPVYNVEHYIRQALDSIVNQTLSDIENDFTNTFNISTFIEGKKLKRNKLTFKLFAGIFSSSARALFLTSG